MYKKTEFFWQISYFLPEKVNKWKNLLLVKRLTIFAVGAALQVISFLV